MKDYIECPECGNVVFRRNSICSVCDCNWRQREYKRKHGIPGASGTVADSYRMFCDSVQGSDNSNAETATAGSVA